MIKNIAILGLGLIGGSIAKALKSSGVKIHVGAFDKEDILEKALKEGTIDRIIESYDDSVGFELIFLCLPVDLSLSALEYLAPKLTERNLITDVCGVKGLMEDKWAVLESEGVYIGGHPMTGKERGGYVNSDPLLFENSIYIISESAKEKKGTENLLEIVGLLGANVMFLDAHLHDQIAANVSHLPQLLSVSLINSAAGGMGNIKFTDFAAGGFRDMTRIASSDFDIWKPVIELNRDKILNGLRLFMEEIALLKENLEIGDMKMLEKKFEAARYTRDEIPKNTKGFLSPLHDLYVFVKDEPGIISKISTALYNDNINIKDIELLKIREGTGGTFRLAFESKADSEKADEILGGLGFVTKA